MKPRIIGLYLPQYHPIPENDEWWGKGFTEWTNVAKARPIRWGHHQPRIPADLGFYDLRMPEVREQQAQLAREAGLEGFCYYHYWFGNGKQLLQRPFEEVLASGKPDFPFCLCWANHDWTNKSWKKEGSAQHKDSTIMKMEYSREDHIAHFMHLLPAFKDKRYIKVDGKPLFAIWAPRKFTDVKAFIDLWQDMAKQNGLEGIHFVGYTTNCSKGIEGSKMNFYNTKMAGDYYRSVLDLGFDAVISSGLTRAETLYSGRLRMLYNVYSYMSKFPSFGAMDYWKVMKRYYVEEDSWENVYPTLLPQWDRTPRAGAKTDYLIHSCPEKFRKTLDLAFEKIKNKKEEHQIVFLKAWNEWGEGDYVEPDLEFGHGWLDAIRDSLQDAQKL